MAVEGGRMHVVEPVSVSVCRTRVGRTSSTKCVGTADVQLFIDLCDNAYAHY